MLGTARIQAFIPTRDADAAKRFYADVLGLRFVADDSFALVFDANGTELRIQRVQELTPHPFTALGWIVDDITAQVRELASRGVTFERYDFVTQDELGIWTTPGAKVAWFKDPDGNLLSLAQLGMSQ
jgi:catechol 2,3-dioxygenase-like lactoylglutathione lyase family enzyme